MRKTSSAHFSELTLNSASGHVFTLHSTVNFYSTITIIVNMKSGDDFFISSITFN